MNSFLKISVKTFHYACYKTLAFKKNILKKNIYANETLAFYSGLSILENFKDYDINGHNSTARVSIKIPKTYNESNYLLNTYIDLYFGKREKQINVLSFANIFFLLERLSAKESATSGYVEPTD